MIGALIFLCVVIAIVVWAASLLRLEANRMLAEIDRLSERNERLEAALGKLVTDADKYMEYHVEKFYDGVKLKLHGLFPAIAEARATLGEVEREG